MRFRGPEALNDKQGNSLLRFLLVEGAQAAARIHSDWRRRYVHLAMRRHKSIAKVAMGGDWRFACTGCGAMVANIRGRSGSIRARDSSVPDMVGSRTPST